MAAGEPPEVDRLLRALADPTRRRILELLGSRPGMTTNEIAARIPGMTRWGVMKHLGLLAGCGLVQTLPDGRRRRHFRENGPLAGVSEWLASLASP